MSRWRSLIQPLAILLLIFGTPGTANEPQKPLASGSHPDHAHRIAIIGGGAAGSSAAYHLHKFAEASDNHIPLEITLFEKESRIGGRTTTVNALNDSAFPVELGGSIFVEVNHILSNFTRDFGLDVSSHGLRGREGSDYDLGVWDGEQFVFKQSSSNGRWKGYWDIAKLLWKYGLAPIRIRSLTQAMLSKFLRFYDGSLFPFTSLTGVIEETGLLEDISLTGQSLLEANGAGGGFANDIVQASTRVNYAQNLDQIHGVEALVCMAIEGAMAVQGGNWQIFHEAVKRSGATAMMNTSVTKVAKEVVDDLPAYHLSMLDGSTSGPYDTLILAAPYQFAEITFDPPLAHTPVAIDYVSLHVTLLTSPHAISPTFFNMSPEESASVPSTILTTRPTSDDSSHEPHKFFSISTLRTLSPSSASNVSSPQYLYKIFSPAPLTATFLSQLFAIPYTTSSSSSSAGEDPISALPSTDLTWSREKVWHSYPYEVPRTEFEHIRLDGSDLGVGRGVYYTSGIESFISTMETSALMGRNVAGLIIQELAALSG